MAEEAGDWRRSSQLSPVSLPRRPVMGMFVKAVAHSTYTIPQLLMMKIERCCADLVHASSRKPMIPFSEVWEPDEFPLAVWSQPDNTEPQKLAKAANSEDSLCVCLRISCYTSPAYHCRSPDWQRIQCVRQGWGLGSSPSFSTHYLENTGAVP